jgi:hypothetical protein
MSTSGTPFKSVRSVLGDVGAETYRDTRTDSGSAPPATPIPFITISRQAGAGGHSLASRLVRRLNEIDPGPQPWTCWDNELLARVAGRYNLAPDALEAYEDGTRSWLQEFFRGLSSQDDPAHPDELVIHRRISRSIRELARIGRCVVVGRGGMAVTADMPGGLHIRLVAPLEHRVAAMAAQRSMTPEQAGDWVRTTDRSRDAFHQRYWPTLQLAPEHFAITLNAAAGSFERLAESVLPLVPIGVAAGR